MSSCGNPSHSNADEIMPRRLKYDRGKTCVRCKDKPGRIVIRYVVYCKTCFYAFVTQKFRRVLDPTINPAGGATSSQAKGGTPRDLKASGNLCVGFSGGIGSAMLMDMIYRSFIADDILVDEKRRTKGKNYPSKARVWEKCFVVHVDLGSAYSTERATNGIDDILSRYKDMQLITVKIESAFDHEWWSSIGGLSSSSSGAMVDLSTEDIPFELPSSSSALSPQERLQKFMSSLPTQSARTSTLIQLTRLVLVHTAHHLNCSHLMLGNTLTSIAIGLISSVSEGGGYHVREELEEEKLGVRIVKPLRDISLKEGAMWIWWREVPCVYSLPSTSLVRTNGIRELTKEFILGLEREFPSTVSTITRTSAKVTPKASTSTAPVSCAICLRAVQDSIKEWKESIAIRSFIQPLGLGNKAITEANTAMLTPHLCYVCHTNLTSRGPRAKLSDDIKIEAPVWTSSILTERRLEMKEMKTEIGSFLLGSSDEEVPPDV